MNNRRSTPDHGQHFVTGGELAPNRAPQPLDHFKRGYRERADQRERETEFLSGDFDPNRRPSEGRFTGNDRHSSLDRRDSGRESRPSNPRGSFHGGGGPDRRSSMDRGDDRGNRGQIIMGLDVQSLVDRLCRRDIDVFRELDNAREAHSAVFQSGKAVTAIISNLARRRNLRLATTVWDWIDSVGIRKNTFHYNSMISVCEKVRDYNKALRLLDEMKEKQIQKNEVTFSSAISACEKCGQWRIALDLLDQMVRNSRMAGRSPWIPSSLIDSIVFYLLDRNGKALVRPPLPITLPLAPVKRVWYLTRPSRYFNK
jgi:pentatricopeptide repeat protein